MSVSTGGAGSQRASYARTGLFVIGLFLAVAAFELFWNGQRGGAATTAVLAVLAFALFAAAMRKVRRGMRADSSRHLKDSDN